MTHRPIQLLLAAAFATMAMAGSGLAHGTNAVSGHHGLPTADQTTTTQPAAAASPLPFDVGGAFDLVDQTGAPRTQTDPDGRAQLLFFGYANCPGICTAALPMMADAVDILADRGLKVRPLLITVDPDRDTVGNMGAAMARLHPDFIGLTGTEEALESAYKAFSVEKKQEYVDPEYGAIYSHGSFVYLLDAKGDVLTLFPPILQPDRVASIVQGYLQPQQ